MMSVSVRAIGYEIYLARSRIWRQLLPMQRMRGMEIMGCDGEPMRASVSYGDKAVVISMT